GRQLCRRRQAARHRSQGPPRRADRRVPAGRRRSMTAYEVGLLEGMATTRAIRRYRDEPVPPDALQQMLFAATRAPSGSNRQPFRFLVLTDGERARQAKRLI